MGAAYFYHLTRSPLENTLPVLLEKSLAAGWRVVVRGVDSERMDWLDQRLWLGPDDGFLPHGLAGGANDAMQPILLTTHSTPSVNSAACLIAIDGADVDEHEVARLERVCVVFDGNDDAAVQKARAQWKALTESGCRAQYWSEETGRWQKKAESKP